MIFFTNFHVLNDGFGETLRFVVYSMLFAEHKGWIFHYTPFLPTMQHNYDKDPDFLKKKEELMRFHLLFPLRQPSLHYDTSVSKFDLIHFFETNIDRLSTFSSFLRLKNVLRLDRKRPRCQMYAAIHIRRMNQEDLRHSPMMEGCDVPDSIYSQVCVLLHQEYPGIKIHIFSQSGNSFDISSPTPLSWRLDEPVETTFLEMMFADVLVVAPSALSYTAGLFSDNQVWYIKSCFRPIPSWRPILGYSSTRDAYRFTYRLPNNHKLNLLFDSNDNKFYCQETGREVVFS